jgi:hypothetical protein
MTLISSQLKVTSSVDATHRRNQIGELYARARRSHWDREMGVHPPYGLVLD